MDTEQANQRLMRLRERNRREKEAAGLFHRKERPSLPDSPDDFTHPCPYCGAPILPYEFNYTGTTRYYKTEWCTCEGAIQAQAEQTAQRIQSELSEKLSELLAGAKVSIGRYAKMSFDTWDIKRHKNAKKHLSDVINYCIEVTEGGNNLCYLHGQYGRGKTHLAIGALRRITEIHIGDEFPLSPWRPYFVEWLEHCSAVQQSWDDDATGPTEGQLWSRMKGAMLLVIDDVDKGRPSEWAIGKLLEVVQHRYMREKPTIVTANHSLQELQKIWEQSDKSYVRDAGGAIASRWMGQLWGQIEVTGPDQRDA